MNRRSSTKNPDRSPSGKAERSEGSWVTHALTLVSLGTPNESNYSSCSIQPAKLRFIRTRVSSIMAWVRRSRSLSKGDTGSGGNADGWSTSASPRARTA